MHVVQKAFGGPGGRRFEPNELVDATGWRNITLLLEQRYLRLATQQEIANAVEEEDEDEQPEDMDDEDVIEVEEDKKQPVLTASTSKRKKAVSRPMQTTLKKKRKGAR